MRTNLFFLLAVTALASSALAQSVCLPLPRLLTTKPMGAQVGAQVEVVVTGEHCENIESLTFSHPGITATQKLDAAGVAESGKFIVSVTADCPVGLHEARLMTRLGITSPRMFSIGALAEAMPTSANTTLATAFLLNANSVVNGVVTARSSDFFSFDAKQGQRYAIHCDARGIDSKLDPVVIVADSAGRDMLVERRGGTIDFTATTAGSHVIKVQDLTFKGGSEFFYRLTLTELSADAALPQFAKTRAVNQFSWPPTALESNAAIAEAELTDKAPQAITLPCDIAGSFFPAADVDTFEFAATKGDVWWIEVASERLGRPTDPSILVQRVVTEGDRTTLVDVVELTDIPSPVKVSSNGYAYDGPPYDGGSADINGRLEIPEDGTYRLQMTDLYGGTRNDPANAWRLIIRKHAPDFAVVAWGLHMELRNGDRNAVSKPLALRGGSTVALEVVAFRRDGFDGPIELAMTGLPDGVTAHGLTIPADKSRSLVLISADQNAPRSVANVQFTGRASVAGVEITHECPIAMHAWPIVDSWSEIPYPRLTSQIPVSVTGSEFAPVTIAATENKTFEATAGSKLVIPVAMTKRCEFSGPVLQLKTFGEGFESHPQFEIPLSADTSDVTLDLAALNVAAGDYQIAFYGSGVAKYRYNPDGVKAAESAVATAEQQLKAADESLQQLSTTAASAPVETKAQADEAVTTAAATKQAAEEKLAAAQATLKSASELATPRDTADIVISQPISIRVLPATP